MIAWDPALTDLVKYAFFAGIAYAALRQMGKDVDGIGKKQRITEAQTQRRWLLGIADQIETSKTLDEAKHHAKLLKEEAWKSL